MILDYQHILSLILTISIFLIPLCISVHSPQVCAQTAAERDAPSAPLERVAVAGADGDDGDSTDEQWLSEMLEVLDETTEIATKSRLNADYVPGTVTVLHGRELEALGMRTVWEALSLIPGVMTTQDDRGGLFVAVRGISAPFNAGNIKVLLNSVPMSRDDSGVSSQALALPIEQVERIEFIRGPGAVLYGDFAFNGVLNILTRKGKSGAFGRVDEHGTLTTGGYVTSSAIPSHSAEAAPSWDVNVAGSTGHAVEAPDGVNADDDQQSGIATFSHRGFQMTAQVLNRNYHNDQNALRDERTSALQAQQQLALWPDTTAQVYLSYVDNDVDDGILDFEGTSWEAGAELSWKGMAHHHWLAQLAYTDTQIDQAFRAAPTLPPNAPPTFLRPPAVQQQDVQRRYYSFSLQDQYEASDRLSLIAGIRLDRREDLSVTHFTPRLAAVWRMTDSHVIKAQYAGGYRAPTFWELYPANQKADVELETITTTELSYINRVPQRVVRVTLFHSRIEDILAPLGPPTFGFANQGTSRTVGVELEWEQQWSTQLKSALNLSYSDSRDGRPLPRGENDKDPSTTDWLANLTIFYRPTEQVLLTTQWNYVGERHARTVEADAEHHLSFTVSLLEVWTKGLTVRLGVRPLWQDERRYLITLPGRVSATDFSGSTVWGQIAYEF